MPRRDRRILLALSVLALGLALAQTTLGLSTGFLFMAPALVLALPLLAGRYPGSQKLAAFVRALPRPRRERARPALSRTAFDRLLPRGGRLIACAMAVRPPPDPMPAH